MVIHGKFRSWGRNNLSLDWHSNGAEDEKQTKILATILGGYDGKSKGYGYNNWDGTGTHSTDRQRAVWNFFKYSSWVKTNFGGTWAYMKQTPPSSKIYNMAINDVNEGKGYKGKIGMYILLDTDNQANYQTIMLTTIPEPEEEEENPEMLLIDKQDEKYKTGMGEVSFKIQNTASGKWIKSAKQIEEKNNDRIIYEVEDMDTNNDEFWTSKESEAMKFTTGTKNDYKGIEIKGVPAGTYIAKEVENPHFNYQKNINKTFEITTTEYDDYDNVNIIYNKEDEEPEGNVKISGYVWEDMLTGKNNENNSKKDDNENGIDGVIVYWKDSDGEVISSTKTGNGGKYTMWANIDLGFCEWKVDQTQYDRISNSYVEFVYNGLTYTTVAYQSNGDEDTSKAMENTTSRSNLDCSFGEISNKGVSSNGSRLEYTYSNASSEPRKATLKSPTEITDFAVTADTRTPLSEFRFLEQIDEDKNLKEVYPALTTDSGFGCIDHYYRSCSKHGSHHVCTDWDERIVQWEISNVNCGLIKREQPDMAIVSDIAKVDVIMKGQQYTYTYGNRGLSGRDFKYQVSFSDSSNSNSNTSQYTRPVNPSDIAYINKEGNNPEDLEVYVTYNIKVNNQSSTLVMEPQEIVNYYDSNYTLVDENWSNSSKNGDTYNANGFKAAYTQQLKGKRIEPQQTSEIISIKLKVNNNVVKDLIKKDALFKNVSEIYMYSTYYGKYTMCAESELASSKGMTGKQSAGVDADSAPGNTEIKISNNVLDYSTYEDDTDIAPTFVLVKDDKYKQISGTVYEDTKVELGQERSNERLGNGQNDGEKGVENVKVELLKVKDDGSTELADLYSIKSGEAKTTPAVTYTDRNGHYQFGSDSDEGCVVDNYILKYTYGDDTTVLTNGETTIDGGATKINARNYKSTIMTDNVIKGIMTKNFDNKQEQVTQNDLQWHLTKASNTSIAVDDIDNLQWYFRNGDNSLVQVNVNPTETSNGYDTEARLQIESLINSNFETPVNVSAYSLPFKIQVEYTPNQEYNVNRNGDKEDGSEFDYNWSRFNFGIIERAREDIVVDKTIDNLKITLSNGQVLTEGSPYNEKMDYVRALGEKDVVNNRKDFLDNIESERGVYMEMDSELIQGSTLEVLYKITVTNNSEKDYEYDRKENGNEKYYYYGTRDSELIKQSVEYLADYVDPELVCEAGAGTQNASWIQMKAEKLHEEGNISDYVFGGNSAINTNGLEQGNYTVLVTNAFKNLATGESHSERIYASKLLATQASEHVYENHTEIIQLNGRIARTIDSTEKGTQIAKTYIPGDYIPSLKLRSNVEESERSRLHEQDDDSIVLRITPPTGLENNAIIYISAGVIALVVLAGGIYLIRRKTV